MKTVAIVGGGYCGIITAVVMARKAKLPLSIHVYDAGTSPGKGVAYSTPCTQHLLNVMAGRMSAFPGEPDHFLDWVMEQPEYKEYTRSMLALTYLPRPLYGQYLADIWQKFRNQLPVGITIHWHQDTVTDFRWQTHDQWKVCGLQTPELLADAVVLAPGNAAPAIPTTFQHPLMTPPLFYQNPWSAEAVCDIPSNASVLIIGNGLTMVDTVISLMDHKHQGMIYTVSPHGFNILPHRHPNIQYTAIQNDLEQLPDLRSLFTIVKKHVRQIRKLGLSAEPVIDAIRPFANRLWRQWSQEDRALFVHRVKHYWLIARHRLPIHQHDKIQLWRLQGKLLTLAGKVTEVNVKGTTANVRVVTSTGEALSITTPRIINCTGPQSAVKYIVNPAIQSLLAQGLMVPDPLGLGVEADWQTGQLIGAQGQKVPGMYLLGALRRPQLWESTAVPELREQVEGTTDQILQVL